MTIMKTNKPTDFDEYVEKLLKKKGMRVFYEEYMKQLRTAVKMAEMREKAKMSQVQLAKKIGTTQSNVARMESGEQNFTLSTLGKIAKAFDKELEISLR